MLTSLMPVAISAQFGTELSGSKGMLMAVVTSAGIIIVFVILLLLIFIFYAYGGIFRSVTASKQKKNDSRKTPEADKASGAAPKPAAAAQSPEPADGEIPGEIIAVIAAAVAAMSGGKSCTIRKISRSQRQSGQRGTWAAAGVYENTRPF